MAISLIDIEREKRSWRPGSAPPPSFKRFRSDSPEEALDSRRPLQISQSVPCSPHLNGQSRNSNNLLNLSFLPLNDNQESDSSESSLTEEDGSSSEGLGSPSPPASSENSTKEQKNIEAKLVSNEDNSLNDKDVISDEEADKVETEKEGEIKDYLKEVDKTKTLEVESKEEGNNADKQHEEDNENKSADSSAGPDLTNLTLGDQAVNTDSILENEEETNPSPTPATELTKDE